MAFYQEKIALAIQVLEQENIDMWIIAGQESATNSEPVLAVMTDGEFIGCTALIFNRDGTSAAICTPLDANGYIHHGVFDEVIAFPLSFVQSVADYISKKQPQTIALNYSLNNPASDGLTVGMHKQLQQAFEEAGFTGEVVSAQPIVNVVRGVKLEAEITRIRKACEAAQEIFEAAVSFIKAGMNCQDVYKFFQDEVAARGYAYSWPKSCNPGVFSGLGCPSGHMGAPDFPIKAGDLVNIDFGVIVDGYGCDLQRMYYVLKAGETEAPQKVKEAFYVVRDAIALAAAALKPGTLGIDVDAVARQYVISKGYSDWNASLGHQLGRVAHDGGPLLGPARPRYDRDDLIRSPLLAGFVFTLEPGIETPWGRIGIEENVVIRQDKAEFIIPPQQELYLV